MVYQLSKVKSNLKSLISFIFFYLGIIRVYKYIKSNMTLKLYYDLMSQPSRALYILLKATGCNFESKYVDLRKGTTFIFFLTLSYHTVSNI